MSNDELFDCFGSDDEDDDIIAEDVRTSSSLSQQNIATNTQLQSAQIRDPNCGVCSQLNAEKSLLVHVKNNISLPSLNSTFNLNESGIGEDEEITSKTKEVQKIIDDFCNQRAWMMHIGPEKGLIIQNALKERLDEFVNQNQRGATFDKSNFVCVELGTYCGYGSTILSVLLHHYAMEYDHIDFHLFTVEINPLYAQIAKEIIDLCKLTKYVTILENDLLISGETEDVGLLLKQGIREYYSMSEGQDCKLDFVLIDHDKDSYLSDLQLLERHKMIKDGTTVTADNVVFAGIMDYIAYMQDLAKLGTVTTKTINSMVEYSSADIGINGDREDLFRDGIGKLQK